MSLKVTPPYQFFTDAEGDPLEGGKLYIGTVGLDPETNPISVYWDSALAIPAVQPIPTLAGVPDRSGSPSDFFVEDSDYSITIRDKNDVLIYTKLLGNFGSGSALEFETYADLIAAPILTDGTIAEVAGHYFKVGAGGEISGTNNNYYNLQSRTATAFQYWIDTLPDLEKFTLEALDYETDATAISGGSIASDLSVNGAKHFGDLEFAHCGAVSDMVDTGTAFTGTDAFQAADAAVTYMAIHNITTLHTGENKQYLFKDTNLHDAGAGYYGIFLQPLMDFHLVLSSGSVLACDEAASTTYNGVGGWFCHSAALNVGSRRNYLYGGNGHVSITGSGKILGSWTHNPNDDGTNKQGVRFLSTIGTDSAVFDDFTVTDWRSQFMIVANSAKLRASKCHAERVTASVFRGVNALNYEVFDSVFIDIDDDPVSNSTERLNVGDGVTTNAGNVRHVMDVSRNIFIKTESPLLVGALVARFNDNTLIRCHGGPAIGFNAGDEGYVSPTLVDVSGNNIMACIERRDGVIEPPVLKAPNASSAYLSIYGIKPTKDGVVATDASIRPAIGDYDPTTGLFVPPYGLGTDSKPAGYTFTEGDATTAMSVGGGHNITITRNRLSKAIDLSAVTDLDDLKLGEMFSFAGYIDPPVSDASYRPNGIALHGYLENFIVSDNIVEDMIELSIMFVTKGGGSDELGRQFKNYIISRNILRGAALGIGHDIPSTGAEMPWGGVIEDNTIDVDPYHLHPSRNRNTDALPQLTGAWNVEASAATNDVCYGIQMRGVKGQVIRNNIFANCYQPILLLGKDIPANTSQEEFSDNAHLESNIVKGHFIDVQYNAGNIGIAVPLYAGGGFVHMMFDSDPQSATYGALENTCPIASYDEPISGRYLRGHVLRVTKFNATNHLLVRATDGQNHVIGVDWTVLI